MQLCAMYADVTNSGLREKGNKAMMSFTTMQFHMYDFPFLFLFFFSFLNDMMHIKKAFLFLMVQVFILLA